MISLGSYADLGIDIVDHVATIEIQRPPHNFFDVPLIRSLAAALAAIDEDPDCRAVVLASEGKSFCAGAQFRPDGSGGANAAGEATSGPVRGSGNLYAEAVRLFEAETPIVAAVQGAAIGGGLGLALAADFRIACPEARFAANFARLGFHHGFGLTVTLPALVGQQAAMHMLLTGRRVKGEEALELGLCDELVPQGELRAAAAALAHEIAVSAPLAVRSIRKTMRAGLAERVRSATDREMVEQEWLRKTDDFVEGVRATSDRREPKFKGR
jgi:enoyl-CoA hydratase/carnithine racemase